MKQEIRYVVVLTLISVVAAALLAIVNQVTADPIAQARRAKTLNALQKVLPPFDNEPDQEMIQVEGSEIYPARKDGKLVGVAVKVTDPKGYAGDVTFMVGLKGDPNAPIVNGYDLLAHKETPGLGTKLADEQKKPNAKTFKTQFNGLAFPADGLKVVKDGGTIDAITGATISSRTATNSVNKAVELYKEKAAELASGAAADPAAAPAADPAAEPAPAEEPTAVPAADPAAGSDDGDDKVNEGESPEGEQEVDNV
jgi:electron transport complex protein RnfG